MVRKKLRVRRKGYVTKKGVRVRPAVFQIVDRGKPGRGPKILPKLKKGTLGVDFSKSAMTRRRVLVRLAKRIGERRVMGKLRAIQVLTKRTNPTVSKKAKSDARWIAKSFIGRKRVRTGTGIR